MFDFDELDDAEGVVQEKQLDKEPRPHEVEEKLAEEQRIREAQEQAKQLAEEEERLRKERELAEQRERREAEEQERRLAEQRRIIEEEERERQLAEEQRLIEEEEEERKLYEEQRAREAEERRAREAQAISQLHATVGEHFEAVSKVLMREGELLVAPKIGYLPAGTRMEVLQVGRGRRVRVFEEHGFDGWVSLAKENGEQLLSIIERTSASEPGSWLAEAKREQARRTATVDSSKQSSGPCDKCDGPHATDACPFFKKDREEHKDAWANLGNTDPRKMGADAGNFVLRSAQVVPQPGDGSCLFHSLIFGLSNNGYRESSACKLRQELMEFLEAHPQKQIAGDTLEEWVRWDANASVEEYARRMSCGGWGGGIEMACCSLLRKVNVHVYERALAGFKRISCFDTPQARKTIHVLYQGRMHYDALATY